MDRSGREKERKNKNLSGKCAVYLLRRPTSNAEVEFVQSRTVARAEGRLDVVVVDLRKRFTTQIVLQGSIRPDAIAKVGRLERKAPVHQLVRLQKDSDGRNKP